jgi:hypothetical protein
MSGGFGRGSQHNEEARARISHGVRYVNERRREASRISRGTLRRLREGEVHPAVSPFLAAAEAELGDFARALGGEAISPQRAALIADCAALGLLLRCETARYVQSMDEQAVTRCSSLASARQRILALVGIDERKAEIDLQTYLRLRQREAEAARSAAIVSQPEAEAADAGDRGACADGRGEAQADAGGALEEPGA